MNQNENVSTITKLTEIDARLACLLTALYLSKENGTYHEKVIANQTTITFPGMKFVVTAEEGKEEPQASEGKEPVCLLRNDNKMEMVHRMVAVNLYREDLPVSSIAEYLKEKEETIRKWITDFYVYSYGTCILVDGDMDDEYPISEKTIRIKNYFIQDQEYCKELFFSYVMNPDDPSEVREVDEIEIFRRFPQINPLVVVNSVFFEGRKNCYMFTMKWEWDRHQLMSHRFREKDSLLSSELKKAENGKPIVHIVVSNGDRYE